MSELKHINNILKRFIDGLYTLKDADDLLKHLHEEKYNTEISETMDAVWETIEDDELSLARQESYKEEARLLLDRIRKPESVFLLLLILNT